MNSDKEEIEIEMITQAATECEMLENNLLYARLNSELSNRLVDMGDNGFRVDGSVFMVMAKGDIKMGFNFEEVELHGPTVMSFPHNTVVEFKGGDLANADIYILAYSRALLQDVNISFNAISGEALLERKSPALQISETELKVLLRYIGLFKTLMRDNFNTQLTKHIIASLTASTFYYMVGLLYRRIDNASTDMMGPRRGSYVHDFMKLVHLNYTHERSVNFYASKLFISPKYLSLLVKEATGRSAAQWIDHFVIIEAKNLLRYSGKNIQQIAYDLNFSNQSSFGKYFKNLTGMSPTEFQKS